MTGTKAMSDPKVMVNREKLDGGWEAFLVCNEGQDHQIVISDQVPELRKNFIIELFTSYFRFQHLSGVTEQDVVMYRPEIYLEDSSMFKALVEVLTDIIADELKKLFDVKAGYATSIQLMSERYQIDQLHLVQVILYLRNKNES